MRRTRLDPRRGIERLRGFAHGLAVGDDEARRDGLLRPRAARKQAALHQHEVGALAQSLQPGLRASTNRRG